VKMSAGAGILVTLMAMLTAGPALAAGNRPLTLERVVLVMRHGIRPPTKDPALPAGVTAGAWPRWPAQPGWLTPHGATAIRLLADYDRRIWIKAGLLPAQGCSLDVDIWADTDERTIATGEAFAQGLAPGCALAVGHAASRQDPLFDSTASNDPSPDPTVARAAAIAQVGPGGFDGVVARYAPQMTQIQNVLGCCSVAICQQFKLNTPCQLPDLPTTLVAAEKEFKLKGGLAWAATMSEVLLLEYSEGLPMADVGFGKIDRTGILNALALHPLEFDILHRPVPIARAGAKLLLRRISNALADKPEGARLQVYVGHDTTLAYLGGALGLHWQLGDYPRDDPPPGGGLGFELLRDGAGRRYVRIFLQVQTPDQMRNLSDLDDQHPPIRQFIAIPGCSDTAVTCPLEKFEAGLRQVTS
jgi:4-phytase/acid phosphatase